MHPVWRQQKAVDEQRSPHPAVVVHGWSSRERTGPLFHVLPFVVMFATGESNHDPILVDSDDSDSSVEFLRVGNTDLVDLCHSSHSCRLFILASLRLEL